MMVEIFVEKMPTAAALIESGHSLDYSMRQAFGASYRSYKRILAQHPDYAEFYKAYRHKAQHHVATFVSRDVLAKVNTEEKRIKMKEWRRGFLCRASY